MGGPPARPDRPNVQIYGHTLWTEKEGDAMAEVDTLLCAKCGGPADGWKCAICGSLAREHDIGHLHVGSDRYCTLKCARCQEADVLCTCV
jgi:hypothetical protein